LVTTKKVMKTYKHIWDKHKTFIYQINNQIYHGLFNYNNKRIGYNYKNKRKGFRLEYIKL
jgi:hypothetical protein